MSTRPPHFDTEDECPACRAKPGSPTLCPGCLARRKARWDAQAAWDKEHGFRPESRSEYPIREGRTVGTRCLVLAEAVQPYGVLKEGQYPEGVIEAAGDGWLDVRMADRTLRRVRPEEVAPEIRPEIRDGLEVPSPPVIDPALEAAAPAEEPVQEVRMVAVMSVPMCGWNPHWGCTSEAVRPLRIPIRLAYGAFWHQSMSNLLEEALMDGVDWVLTLDYDSLFTTEQLDHLIGRFGAHPEIDALAALQCKRGTEETPLLTVLGKDLLEVTGQPIQVDTAHFGLTLIRMEALKKVPMPWFVSMPNPEGSYRDLRRTDADIFLWHRWKDAGNTLYVDPLVSIGHLQPLVAEYDEHFNVVHTHVTTWRQRNRP